MKADEHDVRAWKERSDQLYDVLQKTLDIVLYDESPKANRFDMSMASVDFRLWQYACKMLDESRKSAKDKP